MERRDGFEIRRVPPQPRWTEAYPRLIGWPARLRRKHAERFDLEALNREQLDSTTKDHSSTTLLEEPATSVAEELQQQGADATGAAPATDQTAQGDGERGVSIGTTTLPPAGEKLSRDQWLTWIRTGEPHYPRSWTHVPNSTRRQRERHAGRVLIGAPLQFARLFMIRARRRLRRYRRTLRIWRIRTRRRIVRRAMLPTRYRMLDRRMADEAIRFGADLYWANDVTTVRSAYAAARATKARVVYDAHELIWDAPTVTPMHRRMWGAVERWHVGRFDRVSTVCEPIADEMVRRYHIARPIVILNCPRLSETATAGRPEDSPINEFRRPGETLVLFHGSFSPWRGLEQLIQAVSLLPSSYRLVMLGHGIFRKTLEELVEGNGLSDRVTFLHSVPPAVLPQWLAGADM
ncbi:MAG: glycosyltransferase, partial [Actinomycetota bacterium]